MFKKRESIMKKTTFISLFITTHLCLIFMQIYKHSQFVKESYKKQELEQKIESLVQQEQNISQQLYTAKNLKETKKYADSHNMQKIKLNQIKKLVNC